MGIPNNLEAKPRNQEKREIYAYKNLKYLLDVILVKFCFYQIIALSR
jgi:hypothetical protein